MRVTKVDQVIENEFGSIKQIISCGKWKQLNIFSRRQNSLGGGHFHKKTNEFFYLINGDALVKVISISDSAISSHRFISGDCFEIQTFEQHYFKFLLDTFFIVLYSTVFNAEKSDTYIVDTFATLEDIFR